MEETEDWAWSEFGHAEIQDLRNLKRLLAVAATAARLHGGTITKVFIEPRERDAAYDFLENQRVSPLAIGHASAVAAARRASREPFVWLAVDGTSLTLPDARKTKGMGRLGSGDGGKGIKVITCLALDPTGIPIGIGEFAWWIRADERNKRDGSPQVPNGKRPVDEKETQRWLDVIRATRTTFASEASLVRRWWIVDREGDSISLLHEAAQQGDWFTIRSNVNRRIVQHASDGFEFVHDALSAQPIVNQFELTVPRGRKRRARKATMHVSHAAVTLDLRENWSKKRHPLSVNAIWVREVGTTPPDEKPLTWILYTDQPVDTLEQLHLVIYSYMQRWRIEDFHRTWKSGACGVEHNRLGTVDNVIRWASVLAAVAAQAERLKLLSRTDPQRSAADEFSSYELRAIRALKRRYGGPKCAVPKHLTLGQAVLYTAELGGYTGKSSGGPPGSTTIARGLDRIRLVAEGMMLADEARDAPTDRNTNRKGK